MAVKRQKDLEVVIEQFLSRSGPTYRFMQAMAGDLPGYEDANRALFAGDFARFEEQVATWPEDVRDHAALLAADAFAH